MPVFGDVTVTFAFTAVFISIWGWFRRCHRYPFRADNQDRTGTVCLEGRSSTIELYPRVVPGVKQRTQHKPCPEVSSGSSPGTVVQHAPLPQGGVPRGSRQRT